MVQLKPHTIEYKAKIPAKSGSTVLVPTYATGVEYKASVHSMDTLAAFNATGIQMDRPHRLFMEIEDAEDFKVGDQIVYRDHTYVISTPVEISEYFGVTDYASFYIQDYDGDE